MAFSYKNYTESQRVKDLENQKNKYQTYNESDYVKQYRDKLSNHESNKIADWNGGSYGTQMKDALDKILNREKFSYDLNGDALYQQYKDKYTRLGQMAMMDTMGQASAMTGGYGNSYADAVGNQAYQGYLQNLNDVVPELYQLARDTYDRDTADLQNAYGLIKGQYDSEYGEYRDNVADWNAERDYLQKQYNDERTFDYGKYSDNRDYYTAQYNNERSYDYGQYTDAYNRAFGQYQQNTAEDQWKKSYDLQKKQGDQSAAIAKLQAKVDRGFASDQVLAFDTSLISEYDWLNEAKPVTRGNRGNTGNGGYSYKGKTYNNYKQYVKSALEEAYTKGDINELALNSLLNKYGL